MKKIITYVKIIFDNIVNRWYDVDDIQANYRFFDTNSINTILGIKDGMTLSFHHHLRNGDYVQNMVSEEIFKRNIKNIHYLILSILYNNKK